MISEIFLVANFICAIGTLLQVMAVIKNRKILKGYDFVGSLLTFLAVVLFQIGFYLIGEYLSVALGFITVAYWFLVSVYTGVRKLNERRNENP